MVTLPAASFGLEGADYEDEDGGSHRDDRYCCDDCYYGYPQLPPKQSRKQYLAEGPVDALKAPTAFWLLKPANPSAGSDDTDRIGFVGLELQDLGDTKPRINSLHDQIG